MFNKSRQAYYQNIKVTNKNKELWKNVEEAVRKYRELMPVVGSKKLYYLILKEGIKVGRVAFLQWMRDNNLTNKRKRKSVRTTQQDPIAPKFPNLIEGKKPERIEENWVADITYVRVNKTFVFLALITDAFSRKIVGWQVAETLHKELVIKTLEEALQGRTNNLGLIHHSDKGCQYTSKAFIEFAKSHNVVISMTENGSAYENALAERMNGIMKQEFNFHATFGSIQEVREHLEKSVRIYNEIRPHWSLDFLTPNCVHSRAI